MRVREVWMHAADLDHGATVDDLPDGVLDLLLDDVTAALSAKPDCPPALIAPVDRSRVWRLGSGGPRVEASAADLAGWLTGRVGRPDLPSLPRWL